MAEDQPDARYISIHIELATKIFKYNIIFLMSQKLELESLHLYFQVPEFPLANLGLEKLTEYESRDEVTLGS